MEISRWLEDVMKAYPHLKGTVVNGQWTAFIQHFTTQWPLKALYNTA